MLDNIVYFLNIIWTYCTCMYYVSEINEYYYYYYYGGARIHQQDGSQTIDEKDNCPGINLMMCKQTKEVCEGEGDIVRRTAKGPTLLHHNSHC